MLVKDIGMLYNHYRGENHFIVRRLIGTTIHNLKNELAEYNRTLNILKQIDDEEWLLSKNTDMLDTNIAVLIKKIKYKQMQINLAKFMFDKWRYYPALEKCKWIYNVTYNNENNPFSEENIKSTIKKHIKFIFINPQRPDLIEIPLYVIVLNDFYKGTK